MPSTVVADASAVVELLLDRSAGSRVATALRGRTVAVPAHLDAEVLSALSRQARGGDLSAGQVASSIRQLQRAPFRRYPLPVLLDDAWALRQNVATRDALYVALARRLDAPLVTAERRLAAAPDLPVTVTVITS